jgi:phosphodiesterase/alkaline phosphatase D-like protein
MYVRTSAVAAVNAELSETTNFATVIRGTQQNTTVDGDFVALIDVAGLKANTKYFYRAIVNGAAQGEVRSFMTFPTPGAIQPFTFTFGSCQQSGPAADFGAPWAGLVYEKMVADTPRFFLQIGDWTYPDTIIRTVSLGFPIFENYAQNYDSVKASYRNKYHPSYRMQQLMRIAPVDYVYDDHDFGNNNSDGASAPPQALANSLRGYRELFPGYPLPNPQGGIWHKFTFDNCDFFMLDLRARRDTNSAAFNPQFFDPPRLIIPLPATPVKLSPRPGHSILAGMPVAGENQRDWLLRGLRQSTARWKFLCSSVPFNLGFKRVIDSALARYNSNPLLNYLINDPVRGPIPVLFVASEVADKWVGFPEDVQALLNTVVTNKIKNVIVLSGDIHTGAIDDGRNAGFPELVAAGLDIGNSKIIPLLEQFGINIFNKGGQNTATNNFNKAYGRVTVFGNDSVRLDIVDEFGALIATHTVKDGFLPSPTTGIAENTESVPDKFVLHQNYPNPFNPRTIINYELGMKNYVVLKIYDILGREVATLVDEEKPPGRYSVNFDASRLASGVYFYRLTTPMFTQTKVMVLAK